jgi:hypothetical protein
VLCIFSCINVCNIHLSLDKLETAVYNCCCTDKLQANLKDVQQVSVGDGFVHPILCLVSVRLAPLPLVELGIHAPHPVVCFTEGMVVSATRVILTRNTYNITQ